MDKTISFKNVIENLNGMKNRLSYSEAMFVQGLIEDLTVLDNRSKNYEMALNWFCDRVERKEILSKDSYQVFCRLLERKAKV